MEKEKELMNALEVAAHYDDKVIVEEAVKNLIEVTLPIMGNNEPKPSLLEKPLTKPEDFFDFDDDFIGSVEFNIHDYIEGADAYPTEVEKQNQDFRETALQHQR